MATSSIFESFDISDERTAESFANAIEASEKELDSFLEQNQDIVSNSHLVSSTSDLQAFYQRWNKKNA